MEFVQIMFQSCYTKCEPVCLLYRLPCVVVSNLVTSIYSYTNKKSYKFDTMQYETDPDFEAMCGRDHLMFCLKNIFTTQTTFPNMEQTTVL